MKKLSLLLLVLLVTVVGYSQLRVDTIYYDKDWKNVGHKSFATFYRITLESENSNIPNRFRDFWADGTLYAEGEYINNDSLNAYNSTYDGTCLTYYKNGNISCQCEYGNSAHDKVITKFNEQGNILKKESYKDDFLDGKCLYFNSEGNLIQDLEYTNGILNGTQIEYLSDSVKTITQIKDGKLHGKYQYIKNNLLEYEVNFANNIQHGKEIIYDNKGEIIYSALYDNGLLMEEYDDEEKKYKELTSIESKDLRLSYRIYNRVLSFPDEYRNWYVSFANFSLNILNVTDNNVKLNIDNIKVSCLIDDNGKIVENDINLYLDAEKVKILYEDIAQARVSVDGSLAASYAKYRATYTTTTTANSSKVYYGNQRTYLQNSGWNQNVTIDHGEQTSSYIDKRYEDQLIEENQDDIIRLRKEGAEMVSNEVEKLYFDAIVIKGYECKTMEFLSYNELTEQFKKIFKQGVPKQLKFSCVINGEAIELLSNIHVKYIDSKDVKRRNEWVKNAYIPYLRGNFGNKTQEEANDLMIKLYLWKRYAKWQEELFNNYSK